MQSTSVASPRVFEGLDRTAAAVLVLLCACWGLNQVAIKVATTAISPAGQTHELLTGVRRPAGDETGIEWRGAAGGEVGFVLVHTSPRMSWTRGLSSTPDCATGRSPAPEHVS